MDLQKPSSIYVKMAMNDYTQSVCAFFTHFMLKAKKIQ